MIGQNRTAQDCDTEVPVGTFSLPLVIEVLGVSVPGMPGLL